jgi:chromosome segregation protein
LRLKTLELFGFKSFAERTVFDLVGGVTAIVGPNGCGKSNTVDAVKWVLGEQRVKSMRGREMTDVIFNGSASRPAMDLAEVTLRFENECGTLPIDSKEVEVSRRLYRSGDSEYLINGNTRRLKDVRELFMGTGLGPGGYSFMEQGKIDSVLASNPLERRKVFEEAAGISRFRARRHETELKLDKVESNLLRLADILEELNRQQRSLKIQAGKAERYREHSLRARELQAQVALYRFDVNAGQREELMGQLDELTTDKTQRETKQAELRQILADVEVELTSITEKLSTAREQAANIEAREQGARDLADFHKRHLEELERRESSRKSHILELESELESSAAEGKRAVEEATDLSDQLEGMRDELAKNEATVAELRGQVNSAETTLRQADDSLQSLVRKKSELEREEARLNADSQRWRDELERFDEGRDEASREEERVAASLSERKQTQEGCLAELAAEQAGLKVARETVEGIDAELGESTVEYNAQVSAYSKVSGRVEALEGNIARQEGLDEGVRTILSQRKKDKSFLPSFRGLLIDLFQADLKLADAFEAALGDLSQGIVVETWDEALSGAEFLAGGGRGRAAFLVLEAFENKAFKLPKGVKAQDKDATRIIGNLLQDVDILNLDEIRAQVAKKSMPALVVTEQGGIVRDNRTIMTGSSKGKRGLIAVRSELEILRAEKVEIEQSLASLSSKLEELRLARQKAHAHLQGCRERVVAQESSSRRLEHEVQALEKQVARVAAELEQLESRRHDAESHLAQLGQGRERNSSELGEASGLLDQAQKARHMTNEDRDALRRSLDDSASTLAQERVSLATAVQQLQGLQNSARHLEERHEKAVKAIERYQGELSTFANDRQKSAGSIEEEEKKATDFQEQLNSSRSDIATIENELSVVRNKHKDVAAQCRDIEEELSLLGNKMHKAEMKSGELRVAMEALIEHIKEELDLDLVELHQDFTPTEEVDWKGIESELEERKAKLRKLGNVNLQAIDDLAEVEERLEFLTAQKNDLVHSKGQLARILRDIEDESTRLFNNTFGNVREHFQVMFRKLFGGGKADIVLTDPENVLESGIEITARPPGKEARSITLLSGGERTLTAVALLFAIIRAHPCPCCLMDEVDAALDEDNTERFCSLLDEFFDRTQFVLITHSRRTMARADVLFGVTMGERGVSRHVGVRFEDVAADGSFVEDGNEGKGSKKSRDKAPGKSTGKNRLTGKGETKADEPDSENGNGNGNTDVSPKVVAGEVLMDMEAATESQESGGRTDPKEGEMELEA